MTFTLPDLMTASPLTGFECRPGAKDQAAAVLSGAPGALFAHLLRDQESEASLLAARTVVEAFLSRAAESGVAAESDVGATAEQIVRRVAAVRDRLATGVDALRGRDTELRQAVVRQRAPVSLLGGCWLDTVSQPATQPSVIVNELFRQHYRLKGEGSTQRSAYHLRRRALEDAGVYLPEITAGDFLRRAHARPLTALHASWYLALSRLPVSYLPELIGVHYAFHTIGTDDRLHGTGPPLDATALRDVLTHYLSLTETGAGVEAADGVALRRRVLAGVRLVELLETEHVAMLGQLADWLNGLSLDAQVAAIVARHAPYAGRQHGRVKVGGELLAETFADPDLDLAGFLGRLRRSPQLKPRPGGSCRFLDSIRFGGPMFGIFDQREAETLKAWVREVHAGSPAPTEIPVCRVGDAPAERWSTAITAAWTATLAGGGVVFAEPDVPDERELFFRLVNVEHFPSTLEQARHRAETVLAAGEMLFEHGARGSVSDASWFEYSADTLLARVDEIYWGRLVGPYQPLEEIPDRDEVIFGQTLLAMSALVDGVWACRIGNVGRYQRRSDGLLLSVYADEMGLGDLRKNHVTLIWQVMENLSIPLPHIREPGFRDQAELPDSTYAYALHQLCLSMFPDTYYNEILGFNLGIELSGLGRQRMHEAQKLRAHGLDSGYEDVHLSIDNFSTGHARQAVDAIVTYLDDVERTCGGAAVRAEWRRVWRGYAGFAHFAEYDLVKQLTEGSEHAELVI
ncbi:MAG: iron-containing redox enzyme family protein [Micromonosporaceae bacterium]